MAEQKIIGYSDVLIEDFESPLFEEAFRRYFEEMGLHIRDWAALFREMNQSGDCKAFLRLNERGETIGFIQFSLMPFKSSFFEETCGFIREFWVDPLWRRQGQGASLLARAEAYFAQMGVETIYLTSDEAGAFYEKHGYEQRRACMAKNGDPVYVKRLTFKETSCQEMG